MKTYEIINAITNTQYGPSVDYAKSYHNNLMFKAADDKEAIKFAMEKQDANDEDYLRFNNNDADYNNAPLYIDNLWDVTDEDSPRKVEF